LWRLGDVGKGLSHDEAFACALAVIVTENSILSTLSSRHRKVFEVTTMEMRPAGNRFVNATGNRVSSSDRIAFDAHDAIRLVTSATSIWRRYGPAHEFQKNVKSLKINPWWIASLPQLPFESSSAHKATRQPWLCHRPSSFVYYLIFHQPVMPSSHFDRN